MQSCLVMGEDHHIVMHIFENKYGGIEPFKGGFNRKPIRQNENGKIWLWGYGLPLKGMELLINKS